jgi:flagellar motor switch protein FliM
MDPDEKDDLVAAVGEVPVRVRVEIGEALMAARDWASLGRGDVVALGRRVGEPVLLRVEGVALARGELVDLEGEVAVRIVERLVGRETPP